MIITKVLEKIETPSLELVSQTLDWEVSSFKIEQASWDEFQYKPRVTLRVGYNEKELFFKFKVRESGVKATITEHNGNVWEDSCVEMFLSPLADDTYYNLEVSCIGKKLFGFRKNGESGVRATGDILSMVRVQSSLGAKPFAEKQSETSWSITIAVPFTAFWKSTFSPKPGDKIMANFFKCGNGLATPHFLSWQRVETEKPNFHTPQFFGELEFE